MIQRINKLYPVQILLLDNNLVHFEQIKSAFSSVITHNLSTSYPQFKKDKKKNFDNSKFFFLDNL